MAFEQYINFRATVGFVTDGPKTHAETSITANYPTTPSAGDSTGVGYESVGSSGLNDSRDRNASNDPRIAGIHFNGGSGAGSISIYRIDLPSAGTYDITVAAGDPNAGQTVEIEVLDNGASLGTLVSGTTSAAQRFKDATNTQYTETTWPTSQTAASKTFSSTIAQFRLGVGGSVPVWCYIGVVASGGGGSATGRLVNGNLVNGSLIGSMVR